MSITIRPLNEIDVFSPLELAYWRKELKLTQKELARRMGKSYLTPHRWEHGITTMSVDDLVLLKKVLFERQEELAISEESR